MQIVLFILLFTNCKKTEVAGRVYSKNDVPVADATIKLFAYSSSKYADISIVTTTDENGYYSFKFKAKYKVNSYEVASFKGDSSFSYAQKVVRSKVNYIDMKFNN
jgi:hypothetical protein